MSELIQATPFGVFFQFVKHDFGVEIEDLVGYAVFIRQLGKLPKGRIGPCRHGVESLEHNGEVLFFKPMFLAKALEAEIEHIGHVHGGEVDLPVPFVDRLASLDRIVQVCVGHAVVDRRHEIETLLYLVDVTVVPFIPVGPAIFEEPAKLGSSSADLVRVGKRLEAEHHPALVNLHVTAL